jgi:hypothetical protein
MTIWGFFFTLAVAIFYTKDRAKGLAVFGTWCIVLVIFELTDRYFAAKRRKTLQDWKLPGGDQEPE